MNQRNGNWRESDTETLALMSARVRDVAVRKSVLIPANATLHDAATAMRDHRVNCLLIQDGLDNAVITNSCLRDAFALGGVEPNTLASQVALCPLITIQAGAPLLDALIQMQRHGLEWLPVIDQGRLSTVLEFTDVLGYLAIHTSAVTRIAARAQQPTDLKPASNAMIRLIGELLRSGMKPDHIGRLASEVNRAIFRRLFELLMPKELQQDVCFVVMGSEGRSEQILPTDQDNALIVRDGLDVESIMPSCAAITGALIDLGYPRCPGNIMVSNPEWVLTQSQFRSRVAQWIASNSNDDVISLAIFFDAEAVAGDEHLLDRVKSVLLETPASNEAFLARFASVINSFSIPVGVFSRLQVERSGEFAGTLDIKKGGVFPIVHGIRSLALQKALKVTRTVDRIDALVETRLISERFGREIAEAFGYLCSLRAEAGLAAIAAGRSPSNRLRPEELTHIERRILAESLRVVVRLRRMIGQHFRLDVFGF